MKRLFIPLVLLLFLAGCKVGPNYRRCYPALPVQYNAEQPEQTFVPCDSDLVRWWAVFNDPCLNKLLDETLTGNFDLKIAIQQVFQARAQYWVQFTQILPTIFFDDQASRFRRSLSFAGSSAGITPTPIVPTAAATVVPPTQNFFQIGFDAIWELDFFGKFRRGATAAYELYEASEENARDITITVLSEVARTYMTIRSYQVKTALAAEIVQVDKELYALSKERYASGLVEEQQVEAALAALETDSAAYNALESVLKQTIYSLSVLIAKTPESLMADFSTMQPIPCAAGKIPAGVPTDLLRRRHDIRVAERQLAAQTEQIGIALAELFPAISLTGSSSSFAANPLQGANIGYSSDTFSKLFDAASRIWGIGYLLVWPVIDFGQRLSTVQVQKFLQNQDYLIFQKTIISAVQEVEQALVAYFNEEKRLAHLTQVAESNKRTLDLNINLYESGLADYSQVLQSKDAWLTTLSVQADSQQALTIDLIAVYKALGGDWACF